MQRLKRKWPGYTATALCFSAALATGGHYILGSDDLSMAELPPVTCVPEDIATVMNAAPHEKRSVRIDWVMDAFRRCGEDMQLKILSIQYGQGKLSDNGYSGEILDAMAVMTPERRIEAALNQWHESKFLRASILIRSEDDAQKMIAIMKTLPPAAQAALLADEELPQAMIKQRQGQAFIQILHDLPSDYQRQVLADPGFPRTFLASMGYGHDIVRIERALPPVIAAPPAPP